MIAEEQGVRYLAAQLNRDLPMPLAAAGISLRQVLLEQQAEHFRLAGLGNQLLNWCNTHRYCGACGHPTEPHPMERALVCANCQLHFYPRINPCVIVLVINDGKVLLARHVRARGGFYSCLAGFVEAGETPEQTIVREVREEVGIQVSNIRYVKSQSWPFPSQLMLGFFADYAGGDIQVDGVEIEDAKWFDPRELPSTPLSRISVAGELIELYRRELCPDADRARMHGPRTGD